ncbi:MAG: HAMP domain-containing sensor histidine kinase [Verrucomicrobiota bacterium]
MMPRPLKWKILLGCSAILIASFSLFIAIVFATHPHDLDQNHALLLMGAGLGILTFSILTMAGWINYHLRPLSAISKTSLAVSIGKLSERIIVSRKYDNSELGALAKSLNLTFDELERLVQKQMRFSADASHELRTPLTALLGQIQLGRKRERTPEEYANILEICERSAQKIRRITTLLLELSQLDTGTYLLEKKDITFEDLITPLLEELNPLVFDHGSTLTAEIEDASVEADPFRMHQVLTNLIGNALQHNDDPVQILLRTSVNRHDFVIQVIDDGCGLPKNQTQRIFDRFYRFDTTRTQKTQIPHLGLGLSIARSIMEAHGGSLTGENQPDGGAIFTVTLPRRR